MNSGPWSISEGSEDLWSLQEPGASEERFIEGIRECGEYGRGRGVKIILEPVNRYEINFINSVLEGIELLKKIGSDQVLLMPDVFHMNIEDASMRWQLEGGKRCDCLHSFRR